MAEPTSTATGVVIGAVAATTPVIFNALPWFGDHGIVLGAAIAAAIVKTGMQATDTWPRTIKLFLAVIFVSLAMTGTLAFMVGSFWKLPNPVLLSASSFLIGLAHGNWGYIFNKLLDWVFSILPDRKGGQP